jgi:hypothetical protein
MKENILKEGMSEMNDKYGSLERENQTWRKVFWVVTPVVGDSPIFLRNISASSSWSKPKRSKKLARADVKLRDACRCFCWFLASLTL